MSYSAYLPSALRVNYYLLFFREGKENIEEKQKDKTRPLPPWKRDLIERNKKVARVS